MFNRKKIKELENRIFKLENPNGRVLCLPQNREDKCTLYDKCDLIFEYESNKYIKLDSGYFSVVNSSIEKISNETYKIKVTLEHCLVMSCKTISYFIVDTKNNSVVSVDKDMRVVL